MADEYVEGQALRHVWGVKLSEAEWRLTQLTMLLLGVGEPFHQAILVDELDATTAFARVE